jgi:hypothetical protein
MYMLWSQYKLATIIHTEFRRKQITGILNFANWNSNCLTLQTSEFKKKIKTGIFGIKNGIIILLTMGVPEIGTKNQISQPSKQAADNTTRGLLSQWQKMVEPARAGVCVR